MGKFLQEQKDIDFNFIFTGIIQINDELTYITNKDEIITVPAGYITDGYSKPKWTKIIVDGRFEDDIRPSTIHDYLCQYHYYYTDGIKIPVSFKRANDIFFEAMITAGIKPFKAKLMYFAVFLNKNKW